MEKRYSLVLFLFNFFSKCAPAPINSSSHHFTGFFVMPHGGIILDPYMNDFSREGGNRNGSREEAIRLHEAMRSISKAVVSNKPDLVILTTPHGFHTDDRYLFAFCPTMAGDAGGALSNYTASITIAKEDTAKLYWDLKNAGNPVDALSLGVGETQLPLHWAEVIPLHFINAAYKEVSSTVLPPVIYIGLPPLKNLQGLQKLGRDITTSVMTLFQGKKVAVVVSGDLAHTHSKDPRAPYGYNKNSAQFDNYVKQWGQMEITNSTERESGEILLSSADSLNAPARTCGFSGFVVLHSMMTQLIHSAGVTKLISEFYEYAAPTYFGMIVTSWIPQ